MSAFMAAFLALVGALTLVERRWHPHPELPRKLLHGGSGLLTLSFPFLFVELWPVLLLTAGSAILLAAIKFVGPLRRRFGATVDGVGRTTMGEIYFPIAVALLFWLSLNKSPLLFCIPILVLTLADATGALVGLRYGQTRFAGASKSVEGSIAFLAVAFMCVHVPLLLWSRAGRPETLLIALTLALLVMLLEGSAWRGLDNLFIPVGGFFLLQAFLPLDAGALLPRLLVTAGLVIAILVSRRSTTMLDDSLLAGAFLCYVTWALAGWRWIAPPAIAFLTSALDAPPALSGGQRFHTVAAMLAVWVAAIAWLVVARVFEQPQLLYPFTLVFAGHVAIFGLSRLAHGHPDRTVAALAVRSIAASWVLLFAPFVALTGSSGRSLALAAAALPCIAAAVWLFLQVEPGIRNTPQTLARWARQASSAAGGSLAGWAVMAAIDRWL